MGNAHADPLNDPERGRFESIFHRGFVGRKEWRLAVAFHPLRSPLVFQTVVVIFTTLETG